MRPPGRPKKKSLAMRDVIAQALSERGMNTKSKTLVNDAAKLLSGARHGRTTAMDLRVERGKPGQLDALVAQAAKRGFPDRQIKKMKDAMAKLAQVKPGNGRGIEDLILIDDDDVFLPDLPDDILAPRFPQIDTDLFAGLLEVELKAPTPALDLEAVASGALAGLRDKAPKLLPRDPIAVGELGAALPLSQTILEPLVQLAAVGKPSEDGPYQSDTDAAPLLWDDGTSELLVYAGDVHTKTGRDVLSITIPVATDAGRTEMTVPFAMGSADRVAGLVAAAPDRPIGDAVIADIWGEALIAFAYQIVLQVADSIAGASGRDTSNQRLVAQGFSLQDGALVVQSQAAFPFKGVGK